MHGCIQALHESLDISDAYSISPTLRNYSLRILYAALLIATVITSCFCFFDLVTGR